MDESLYELLDHLNWKIKIASQPKVDMNNLIPNKQEYKEKIKQMLLIENEINNKNMDKINTKLTCGTKSE